MLEHPQPYKNNDHTEARYVRPINSVTTHEHAEYWRNELLASDNSTFRR